MRRMIMPWMCFLLTGCAAELTHEGARVEVAQAAKPGCRLLATLHESEGGGLRSLDANITSAQSELRNRSAYLGATTLVVTRALRGDTEEGAYHMTPNVGGLATLNASCTNCVTLTANAYECSAPAAPAAPAVVVAPAAPACPPATPPVDVAPISPPPPADSGWW
jgi:Domain of unknown function (DUF4156)